jgi:hypothetical protein
VKTADALGLKLAEGLQQLADEIFYVSSIFWNLKRLPIQGSPIARCGLHSEHGDAKQSDAHEKAGHQTPDGPLRIDLQSNQICAGVVPPSPPEWRDAAAGNTDPGFLKQAVKLLRFIGGSSRRRAEPGHGLNTAGKSSPRKSCGSP